MTSIKNKTLMLLLAFAFNAFAAWTGSNSEPSSTKTIDGKNFYEITTPDEMAWFAKEVNNGNTQINAILKNDIVFGKDTLSVSSRSWTPIGTDSTRMFDGVFDGEGHSIYGIKSLKGIFGYIGEFGVVRNFSSFCDTSTNCIEVAGGMNDDILYAGGVAAYNKGLISNVHVFTNVSARFNGSYSSSPTSISGGVVGYNLGTIQNCYNQGSVSSSVSTTGNNNLFVYVGGIAGYNGGNAIDNINDGEISGSAFGGSVGWHYTYMGGIIGYNVGPLSSCLNNGNVLGGGLLTHKYDRFYIGGIAGFNNSKINKSENTGRVSKSNCAEGYGWIGGIVGSTKGKVSNCKNSGNVVMLTNYENQVETCPFQAGGINGDDDGSVYNSIAIMDSVYNNLLLALSYNPCARGVATMSYYSYFDSTKIKTKLMDYHSKYDWAESIGFSSIMKTDSFAWILNAKKAFDSSETNSGEWSRRDSYPIFADSLHLAIRRVVFDNNQKDTVFSNYKGKIKFPQSIQVPEDKIFVGWYSKSGLRVDSLSVISEDMVLSPRIENVVDSFFSIRFYNADSTLLDSLYVKKYSLPSYDKERPSLTATAEAVYRFAKWNKNIDIVENHTDYYAIYDTLTRLYTVTFIDFNDSIVEQREYVYNAIPQSSVKTIERSETVAYSYLFVGWDKPMDNVKSDQIYQARYDSTKNKYIIKYLVGSYTLQKDTLEYGSFPKYVNETPKKSETARYAYVFKGWDPLEASVEGNMTYKAVFDTIEKKYFVVFQNGKDTLQIDSLIYGAIPEYKGKTPTKSSSSKYEYKFAGWSPKLTTVTEKVVYKAVFDSTAKSGLMTSRNFAKNFAVSVWGTQIQIANAKIGSSYALFDLQGHIVVKGVVKQKSFVINAKNRGRYILRIGLESKPVVVK